LFLSVLFGLLFGAADHQWIGAILGTVLGLAIGLLFKFATVALSYVLLCPRPVRTGTYYCASAFVLLCVLAVPTASVGLTLWLLSAVVQVAAKWAS
jgi:hypothetical protein